MGIPATKERVQLHTADHINECIERDIEANVCYYSRRPELIEQRLRELDQEWDIERVLETNASGLMVGGFVLSALASRRWLLVPAIVGSFLLLHGVQGWCPPLPVLRRLGIRTSFEIAREKFMLKSLRGDFDAVNSQSDEALDQKIERARQAVGN